MKKYYFKNITIVGITNSGKSTLFNRLHKKTLSIVTKKQQTTIDNHFNFLKYDKSVFVFIDTPGFIFDISKKQYYFYVIEKINLSLQENYFCLLILNATKNFSSKNQNIFIKFILKRIKKENIFLIINKIDLINNEILLQKIKFLYDKYKIINIIPISALKKTNITYLLNLLQKHCDESIFEDEIKYLPIISEKEQILNILRQGFLLFLNKEIPYGIKLNIFDDKYSFSFNKIIIQINIFKKQYKKMIIGKNGEKIQKIQKHAKFMIYKLLKRKINFKFIFKLIKTK